MSSRLKARLACWLMLLSFVLLSTVPAWTQDKKAEAQLRTVHGGVIDGSKNRVPSAVVYLVNLKTQAVKTYIADESGNYRFSGLDPNADYELHAEHNDSISPTHTVSTFNSHYDIEITLKLSNKKKA
jgi:protocatechuate 3,4-dioxygenase beta subunit